MVGIHGGYNAHSVLGNLTLNQLSTLASTNPGAAAHLMDQFSHSAGGYGMHNLMGHMSPFGHVGSPMSRMPYSGRISGAGYHGGQQTIDLAGGQSNTWFSRVFGGRRQAAKFERFLKRNPAARAAFENAVGGRIQSYSDGLNDGRLTIQRFAPGYAPIPGFAQNPMANTALGMFSGMESSILGQAGRLGLMGAGVGALGMGVLGGNPFGGFLLGGLGGIAGGLGMGMLGGGALGMGGGLGGGLGNLVAAGGTGSWNPLAMPGRISNTNPLYERAHQVQVATVLNDPSLTVEDKVTLMLMLIMKKQDRDIERQANYISAIQNQQGNKSQVGGLMSMAGGALGTVFGGPMAGMLGGQLGGALGGANQSPSIDVETMKLKRMIDKRSQMFDMLRQIIDKYNETAKGIIQSIGR